MKVITCIFLHYSVRVFFRIIIIIIMIMIIIILIIKVKIIIIIMIIIIIIINYENNESNNNHNNEHKIINIVLKEVVGYLAEDLASSPAIREATLWTVDSLKILQDGERENNELSTFYGLSKYCRKDYGSSAEAKCKSQGRQGI